MQLRDARSTFWVLVRLYVGAQWLRSALPKLVDDAWIGHGTEVRAFLERAVSVPAPPARPPVQFPMYRAALRWLIDREHERNLARAIVAGQLFSGCSLVTGAWQKHAAGVGLLQNLAFSLAGSGGHNGPMIAAQAALLMRPPRGSDVVR